MGLISANWHPHKSQLRQFGLLCLLVLPGVAWLWSASAVVIGCCAFFGILLAILAFVRPKAVTPVFVGLMLITLPIGLVVSELVLLLVYACVFLPIGVLFRVLHRDRLQRTLDARAESYWSPKRRPKSVASYYRQS